jgi:mono/diheme cytochrome c family protein
VSLTTIRLAVIVSLGSAILFGFQRLSADEAKKLKNPVPYSRKSIGHGSTLFAQSCSPCHGPDGKSQVDVIGNATDLTSPRDYKSGTSDGEIFRSIRDGAGDSMPSFRSQLAGDSDIWDLVNFVHSLWPEAMRPPLVEDKSKEHHR